MSNRPGAALVPRRHTQREGAHAHGAAGADADEGVGDHQSGMVDRRAIDVVERGRGDDLAQAIEVVGHEATSAA